jgi:hypothetical protein
VGETLMVFMDISLVPGSVLSTSMLSMEVHPVITIVMTDIYKEKSFDRFGIRSPFIKDKRQPDT